MNFEKMSYAECLDLRIQLNNHISAIEADAESRLRNGEEVPGFSLKKGRKVRSVTDEPILVIALEKKFRIPRDRFYTRKLVGIPAIEKILAERNISKLDVAAFLHDHITVGFSASSMVYTGEVNNG